LVELKKFGTAYQTIKEGLDISQIAELTSLRTKVIEGVKLKFHSSPFVRYTNRPIFYYQQIPYCKIVFLGKMKLTEEKAKQLGFTSEHSSPLCSMIRDEEQKQSLQNIFTILMTIDYISVDDLIMIIPLSNYIASKGEKILTAEQISNLMSKHPKEFFLIVEIILEKLENSQEYEGNQYDETIVIKTFERMIEEKV
jgi:hypothetical protein